MKQSINDSVESTKDSSVIDCHDSAIAESRNDAPLSSLQGQRPKQSIKDSIKSSDSAESSEKMDLQVWASCERNVRHEANASRNDEQRADSHKSQGDSYNDDSNTTPHKTPESRNNTSADSPKPSKAKRLFNAIFTPYNELDSKDYKTYRDISIFAIINICFLICVFSPFALYSSDVTQFDSSQSLATLSALVGFFLLSSFLAIYLTSFFYKTRLLKIGVYGFSVALLIGLIYSFVLDFNVITGESYGAMEQMMFLDTGHIYNYYNKFVDFGIGVLSCVVVGALLMFARQFLAALKIIALSLVILSSINLVRIILAQDSTTQTATFKATDSALSPTANLSLFAKDRLNIVVLMLDAFTGSHFKILLEQNPTLNAMLDGFTYYDNTTTASSFTHTSLPSVFGGDYYSSANINARKVPSLEVERNNAIINIASNFLAKDFALDFDIYAVDFDYITQKVANTNLAFVRDNGYYQHKFEENHNFSLSSILDTITSGLNVDALLSYGIFKFSPYSFRTRILLIEEPRWRIQFGEVKSSSIALKRATYHISQLSTIIDDIKLGAKKPTLKFIASGLTHDSFVMDIESCKPSLYPQPKLPQEYRDLIPKMFWGKYNSEVCALREVERMIATLKQNNIYDNTMIVIVSDHGRADSYPQLKAMGNSFPGYYTDTLLLVKSPQSRGELRFDSRLMINSDVASLICDEIGGCENVPPNILKNYPKNRSVVHFYPKYFQGEKNPKDRYEPHSLWKVSGDIYNPQNWEQISQ